MGKLFHYLKPFRLSIAAALTLVMVRVLTELYLPTLTAEIVNNGITRGDTAYIIAIGSRMLLVAALGGIASIAANHQSAKVSAAFARVLREKVFSQVENFSLHEFDKFGTASLITRTTNDITQLQMVLLFGLRMMAMAPLMSIGGIIMAVSLDPALSLIFVTVLPLLFALITIIGRRGIPLFQKMQVKLDNLNLVLRESLTGIRVIRAFNCEDYEKQRFQGANQDYTTTTIKVHQVMSVMMPAMMLVMNLTTIGIIWFGGLRIDSGFMQVGDLMAFIQYGMHIMFSLVAISFMLMQLPRALASAHRISEVLDTVPEIRDPQVPVPIEDMRGFVEFKKVTFSYPGAERPALYNISFSAGPGQVTAIIGGTGSGKSTLSRLLLRFYDIDSGSILVDGVDIRSMTQADLRAKVGFAPQQAILFSGSIRDNILFGKDKSDAEVVKAAEIAQATEFIARTPAGFASEIAQGGKNISGGQKQRLAIARALVHKPKIYIFDECFSALDFKTDAKLRAALKEETAGATVIIIAQRVSTIRDADQIIVLEKGRIAGIGTHEELLATNGVYKEIVFSQLSEEEIA
ncbi:MAG: ABC transporter ATP-binding protein [bacterium]|jgi:ATP-binding cassette subfamily B multidrug efflux pump